MNAFRYAACLLLGVGACTTETKFIDPRTDLDRKIYYVERDNGNDVHGLSSTQVVPRDQTVERVPAPAPVDINSTIQIRIAKTERAEEKGAGALSKELESTTKKKQSITTALDSFSGLIQARKRTLEAYQAENSNIQAFFEARAVSEKMEADLIDRLTALWPDNTPEYADLVSAYDPPRFESLQDFLKKQISSLDAANSRLNAELRIRRRTLVMEAFLISPGKDPAAIHLEGYDSIKAQSLRRDDPLGLDLSPAERARLDSQVKAAEQMAAALEQLRKGEKDLKATLDQVRDQASPQLSALIGQGEALYARFNPSSLKTRVDETDRLANAFLAEIDKRAAQGAAARKAAIQQEKTKFLSDVQGMVGDFAKRLQQWIGTAKTLKSSWQNLTPSTTTSILFQVIDDSKGLSSSFQDLAKSYPSLAQDLDLRASEFGQDSLKELLGDGQQLLASPQALALRANLMQYARDANQVSDFVTNATATLSALGQSPVTEMPATSAASIAVPANKITDTYIDLQETPRIVGDMITVKATLKDGDTVADTSSARFRVDRFGHYAELSPAVVLVKPREIAGPDSGFRFAPTLSWMHHWGPRLDDASRSASFFRATDMAVGLHSAFLNFNSPGSTSSAQIGLGATVGFWKNRLQFGVGRNMMAKTSDEGRTYYFVGSDLIGLLQALGIAK